MGDEEIDIRTFKQKLLFYTTAFFILLGTASLFSFLFLVPFVIDPAFTTIFMQFDETPALCITYETTTLSGSKNCSWSSCREGCTKDIYYCTQIRVNYKLNLHNYTKEFNITEYHYNLRMSETEPPPVKRTDRYERAIRDYDYIDGVAGSVAGNNVAVNNVAASSLAGSNRDNNNNDEKKNNYYQHHALMLQNNQHLNAANDDDDGGGDLENDLKDADADPDDDDIRNNALNGEIIERFGNFLGNDSEWYYGGARLFPNVKGCGYPPMLNCTIWLKRFLKEGTRFPCYYSKVDPGLVISDLDMWKNTLNLVYSMAIPIPSFIISIIYLTFAYFKIYNEDEESAPLDKNAEGMAGGLDDDDDDDDADAADGDADEKSNDDVIVNVDHMLVNGDADIDGLLNEQLVDHQIGSDEICVDIIIPNGTSIHSTSSVGGLTPISSDLNSSFGHQLKVKMADEMSRESLDVSGNNISNSGSIQGNLSKTMTTSISTPPGPTAAV